MTDTKETTWTELVAPTVAKCKLCRQFDLNAVWNPDGADALGQLIQKMATTLDEEIARQESAKITS